ncbi:hypothetical protein PARPLA_01670 [Rhodobacteraceae bacterium THAF1]|nr:hypothetical protein FIU81_09005 [Palleronia sp. THAF1]VDC23945.1 hypothetical protein PARPLA_01670 [Rhodobacteraceae bacterium THAF1]
MTTDCTSTPFGVSEPLLFLSTSSIARRFTSILDLLDIVINLEPEIAGAWPGEAPGLQKRQDLMWEHADNELRSFAGKTADTSNVQSPEALRLGILAFLMHRTMTSETPEDVAHFSARLDDAVFDWLDVAVSELALHARARELTQAFASVFDLSECDIFAEDLFPVL